MANEIKLNVTASLTNGDLKDSFSPATDSITQATQLANAQVVSLTTSETDVAFTGITTPGYLFIQNLDATNYITFGPKSGGVMILFGKLKPGEFNVIRLGASVTLRMLADTATCKVALRCWND